MPNADYMDGQSEINWSMRQTLVDWLLQVHLRYHMLPETLWIAVNIVDRFLTKRVVSLIKLQLVGVTAMFVAAKYEEIMAPSVDEFVYMTEKGYTKEEILKGERIVLQTLDFKVSQYCSPYSWMRKISKADDYDIQTRTLSKFLTEVTLLDYRFLRVKPSMVAAIGMYTARKMLGGDWVSDCSFMTPLYRRSRIVTIPRGKVSRAALCPCFVHRVSHVTDMFIFRRTTGSCSTPGSRRSTCAPGTRCLSRSSSSSTSTSSTSARSTRIASSSRRRSTPSTGRAPTSRRKDGWTAWCSKSRRAARISLRILHTPSRIRIIHSTISAHLVLCFAALSVSLFCSQSSHTHTVSLARRNVPRNLCHYIHPSRPSFSLCMYAYVAAFRPAVAHFMLAAMPSKAPHELTSPSPMHACPS